MARSRPTNRQLLGNKLYLMCLLHGFTGGWWPSDQALARATERRGPEIDDDLMVVHARHVLEGR